MFPSVAFQEMDMIEAAELKGIKDFAIHHYSWRKGVYFLASSVIICLCLISVGLTV